MTPLTDLCWCLCLFLCLHFLFLLELFQLFSLLCFFFQLCFCLWWTCKKKRTKLSWIVRLNFAVHKILHKYLWTLYEICLPSAVALVQSTAGLAFVVIVFAAGFVFCVTDPTFSQSAICPKTFKNCGWLMQVVNHLVTLITEFLSEGSNAWKQKWQQNM